MDVQGREVRRKAIYSDEDGAILFLQMLAGESSVLGGRKSATNVLSTTATAIMLHSAVVVWGEVHEENAILVEKLASYHAG